MNKTIFSANLNVMKVGAFSEICEKLGIDNCTIAKEDYHTTMSTICGMVSDKKPLKDVGAEPGEFITFYGFDEKGLDEFIEVCKEKNLVIPYKAMITVHNLSWSPAYLYQELVKEHEKMNAK